MSTMNSQSLNSSVKKISKPKNNRILSDLKELMNNDIPETIKEVIINEDNIYGEHQVFINGPKDTPFEGGVFKLLITLPSDYPFKPPVMHFSTYVYHPNISREGSICIDILKDQWSSALRLYKVVLSISDLLSTPNPDDPLSPDVAHTYKSNRDLYIKKVKEAVQKYASGNGATKDIQ